MVYYGYRSMLIGLAISVVFDCQPSYAGVSFPAALLEIKSIRAASLGGSYTSLAHAQDPMSSAINPAAPAVVTNYPSKSARGPHMTEVTLSLNFHERVGDSDVFGKFYSGGLSFRLGPRIPLFGLGKALPMGVALYTSTLRSKDSSVTDDQGNALRELQSFESASGLAIALETTHLLGGRIGLLYIGANLELLQQTIHQYSENTYAASLGFVLTPSSRKWGGWKPTLGAALLRPTSLPGSFNRISYPGLTGASKEDSFPEEINIGVSLRKESVPRDITFTADISWIDAPKSVLLKPALEVRIHNTPQVFARMGLHRYLQTPDAQFNDIFFNRVTFGFGVEYSQWIRLDYAFLGSDGKYGLGDQHRIGLVLLRLGLPRST